MQLSTYSIHTSTEKCTLLSTPHLIRYMQKTYLNRAQRRLNDARRSFSSAMSCITHPSSHAVHAECTHAQKGVGGCCFLHAIVRCDKEKRRRRQECMDAVLMSSPKVMFLVSACASATRLHLSVMLPAKLIRRHAYFHLGRKCDDNDDDGPVWVCLYVCTYSKRRACQKDMISSIHTNMDACRTSSTTSHTEECTWFLRVELCLHVRVGSFCFRSRTQPPIHTQRLVMEMERDRVERKSWERVCVLHACTRIRGASIDGFEESCIETVCTICWSDWTLWWAIFVFEPLNSEVV